MLQRVNEKKLIGHYTQEENLLDLIELEQQDPTTRRHEWKNRGSERNMQKRNAN